MWKVSEAINYNSIQAQKWLNEQFPYEEHGLGGDCPNPKCDYHFTPQDEAQMEKQSGWFTCPKCGMTYNYLDESNNVPGGRTNAPGMTPSALGMIGEQVIEKMGQIPEVGKVIEVYSHLINFPIDAVIGKYGVEIKTNHSESQSRFKIGGKMVMWEGQNMSNRQAKILYCQEHGLIPGLLGVRLNFYHDTADIFFREGLKDTWIGNPELKHVATTHFAELNPYPDPTKVPAPASLPDDDDPDSDIPF